MLDNVEFVCEEPQNFPREGVLLDSVMCCLLTPIVDMIASLNLILAETAYGTEPLVQLVKVGPKEAVPCDYRHH